MQTEPTVDWERVKRCLAVIHRESKFFLGRALLIGGAACWFYRVSLARANDPDFKAPPLSAETERKWLSKDIDFTGIFSQDALELLPHRVVTDAQNRKHIEVEGVRIGFAQVGVTFDPEEALKSARVATLSGNGEDFQILVCDPITLCIEKQALSQRRGSQSDLLHWSVLREYLCLEIVQSAESLLNRPELPVVETRRLTTFLAEAKKRVPELFEDSRLRDRIEKRLGAGTLPGRFIQELLSK